MRFTWSRAFLAPLFCLSLVTACGDDQDDNDVDEDPGENLIVNCARSLDGTPCGSSAQTDCDAPDTCLAGQCQHNFMPPGTACGDASSGACDVADTCNGAGDCLPNHFPDGTACGEIVNTTCNPLDVCSGGLCETRYAAAGTPCGSATQTECDAADSCDGSGTCLINHVLDGSACGDATDTPCNPADTCFGGACQERLTPVGTACGDPSVTECDLADTCNAVGDCLVNHVAANTPCGDATTTECDLADTCDGDGVCASNYVAAGTPCGSATDTQCNAADTCNVGTCAPNTADDGFACYDCSAGAGSCDVCNAAVCDSRPQRVCEASALSTTAASGNNQRGNMFTIIAKEHVVIRSFDAYPMSNTTIEIYTRAGGYAGFASDSAGWTLLGRAAVTATGGIIPVPVPVNVEIRAGETQAFYITSNTQTVSINYSNGSSEGAVYAEDANLQFTEGIGLDYPFTAGTGGVFTPRVFNGAIHYDTVAPLDSTGAAYDGVNAQGVMFDLQAVAKTDIGGVSVELEAGTHDVNVYFRRGTFVGHESSPTGWELIGSVNAASSAGGGALTRVSFADRIELDVGETVGLYVDTLQAAQLRTTAGGTVGDIATTASLAITRVGRSVGATFASSGDSPAAVRAVVDTSPCVITP